MITVKLDGIQSPTIAGFSIGTLFTGSDARLNTEIAAPSAATNYLAVVGWVFNGTTWDRERSANGASGTTGTGLTGAGLMGFDGTNWQRIGVQPAGTSFGLSIGSAGTGADAVANTEVAKANAGSSFFAVAGWVFNGTTWDRARSANGSSGTTGTGLPGCGILGFDGTNYQRAGLQAAGATFGLNIGGVYTGSDARNNTEIAGPNAATNYLAVVGWIFNGTTWDRIRNNSGANIIAATQPFAQLSMPVGEWSVVSTPAAATQATASKAAGGGTVRHVARRLIASYASTAVGGGAPLLVNLRDGATGAGTILASFYLGVGLQNGAYTETMEVHIPGSQNTAMTLEFAAAGAANTLESVTLLGYSTPA